MIFQVAAFIVVGATGVLALAFVGACLAGVLTYLKARDYGQAGALVAAIVLLIAIGLVILGVITGNLGGTV